MANVKGSALTSRVLWVQLGHGAGGIDRLKAALNPTLRAQLETGFSKANWYPLADFIELNETIDRVFGRGDLGLVKLLGRYSADANLTTIYRLFFKVGSVHWILGRAVRLWGAHYDAGFFEVATRGPKAAVLRLRGFPSPHRVHCLAVSGFVERALELSGGKRPIVEESKCRTRGDDHCQMDVSWD
ncbi:MAG: 4-vinyl reductase [Kofleriaceae bacterium]